MEFQFHPASGRRTVLAISLGTVGERVLTGVVAAATAALLSLWFTVPTVLRRVDRQRLSEAAERERGAVGRNDEEARAEVRSRASRALAWEDALNKAAFLYGIAPARWPRALDPGRGLLADGEGGAQADGVAAVLRALDRGAAVLQEAEEADVGLAPRTPSIVPIADAIYEPAVLFGPRLSPWTGESEFFYGLDLASPEGSAVVAPAAGRVVFTGRVRRERQPRLWQFGNLVVLAHGSWATVYGHLAAIDVRKGASVARGQRLGAVGKSGWALSPRLHYELWTEHGGRWAPTDPLFGILDRRLDARHLSLEQMRATSAPGPGESLPGLP